MCDRDDPVEIEIKGRLFADEHALEVREVLADCLSDLLGDYASPSILVDGRDVMGERMVHGRSVRLDVPARSGLRSARHDPTTERSWN